MRAEFFHHRETERHRGLRDPGARVGRIAVLPAGGVMKIEIDDHRRVAIAAVLVVVAVVLVGRWVVVGSDVSASAARSLVVHATRTAVVVSGGSFDPTLRLVALRETEATTYVGSGRNIFHAAEERPKVEIVRKVEVKIPELPKVVAFDPIPLSFCGFSRTSGVSTVFLLKGEDVFLAREGDIVDRRYKIVHVRPEAVDIEDLLGERSERLVLRRG